MGMIGQIDMRVHLCNTTLIDVLFGDAKCNKVKRLPLIVYEQGGFINLLTNYFYRQAAI